MTEQTLQPTPSWNTVASEEFGALGVGLRREMQLFALALLLFAALVLLSWLRQIGKIEYNHFDFSQQLFAPVILLGFFTPLSVWKDDAPAQRGYFWSMPVDRTRHAWLKMALGGAWMIGFLAVYLLWMLGLMLVTGGRIRGMPTTPIQLGSEIQWQTTPLPGWFILVAVTGFAIAYLFGSAVVVGSNHPWRWFVGVPIGWALLSALFGAAGLHDAQRVVGAIFRGRYGVGTAFSGTAARAGWAVMDGKRVPWRVEAPDLQAWLIATALWLALALAVFALVARRHQEG